MLLENDLRKKLLMSASTALYRLVVVVVVVFLKKTIIHFFCSVRFCLFVAQRTAGRRSNCAKAKSMMALYKYWRCFLLSLVFVIFSFLFLCFVPSLATKNKITNHPPPPLLSRPLLTNRRSIQFVRALVLAGDALRGATADTISVRFALSSPFLILFIIYYYFGGGCLRTVACAVVLSIVVIVVIVIFFLKKTISSFDCFVP